jgi:hypothetical protein
MIASGICKPYLGQIYELTKLEMSLEKLEENTTRSWYK